MNTTHGDIPRNETKNLKKTKTKTKLRKPSYITFIQPKPKSKQNSDPLFTQNRGGLVLNVGERSSFCSSEDSWWMRRCSSVSLLYLRWVQGVMVRYCWRLPQGVNLVGFVGRDEVDTWHPSIGYIFLVNFMSLSTSDWV
ncbi:hypothetical protein VIGAN_09065400 [Vigna angularis var. angularis]|uniref:Uncharacterized protein n=1 Tax=Vigna angularis var. angularis TaxID=157739 RepID=A0A0S3SWL7_PHAAN|nr:hypothetical protein VIGAN_09065400 [Vigna angularis var. angularis]